MPAGKISIRFAESAVADLKAVRNWYTEQGVPNVGERLISEIFQRVEMLGIHPDLRRIVPEFHQPFLRELIQPPFRIVRIWRSERLLRLQEHS